ATFVSKNAKILFITGTPFFIFYKLNIPLTESVVNIFFVVFTIFFSLYRIIILIDFFLCLI
ncbi:hypothetical protein V2L44_11320, partial [Streptococcus pneumoniae]